MPRPPSARRRLYHLHVWVGFQLAALVSLVLITGTFAVISNEIDWLLRPELRVDPGEARLS